MCVLGEWKEEVWNAIVANNSGAPVPEKEYPVLQEPPKKKSQTPYSHETGHKTQRKLHLHCLAVDANLYQHLPMLL